MEEQTLGYALFGLLLLAGGALTLWFEERRMREFRRRWEEQEKRSREEAKAFMEASDVEEEAIFNDLSSLEGKNHEQR